MLRESTPTQVREERRTRWRTHALCLFLLSALAVTPLFSPATRASDALEADLILARVDEAMGISNRTMEETMVLANDRGQERTRTVKVWNKHFDGMDHMLLRFIDPGNVRGTAFLVKGDDMWIYLPALKRTRRIAGHAKNGNFMGSDFSYRDMEQLSGGDFRADWQPMLKGEETMLGEATYHLELRPLGEQPYTKLELWVSQEHWLPRRIEYYEGEKRIKILTTGEIQQVDGRWTAREITMENPDKGTTTRLVVNEVSFTQPIDEDLFTVQNLERGM